MTTERTTYTITLDDDPMVHKVIEKAMGIPSLPYTSTATLLAQVERYEPLAAFVDVHLDNDDCGLDAIPTLRQAWPFVPIIVITSDQTADAIGNALASGANDFLRKPINRQELMARVKARLQEMRVLSGRDSMDFGPLRFNKTHRVLHANGRTVYLSPSEGLLLACLMEANGMVVTKSEMKRRIWGDLNVSANALDKKIFDLRSSLRDLGDVVLITSAYGVGASLTLGKPLAVGLAG